MWRITRTVAAAASLAAAAAFAQSQGGSGHQGHDTASGPSSGGSQQMMKSMMDGMNQMHSMKMTGDPDRDFAAMMKKHHQMAIEMAQVELNSGKDEKMKAMARKMIEDQRKDIKELDDWMKSRK